MNRVQLDVARATKSSGAVDPVDAGQRNQTVRSSRPPSPTPSSNIRYLPPTPEEVASRFEQKLRASSSSALNVSEWPRPKEPSVSGGARARPRLGRGAEPARQAANKRSVSAGQRRAAPGARARGSGAPAERAEEWRTRSISRAAGARTPARNRGRRLPITPPPDSPRSQPPPPAPSPRRRTGRRGFRPSRRPTASSPARPRPCWCRSRSTR